MSEQSSIYDLGYRHYEGERVGRRGTLRTLYIHSLRSAFGLGRRTSSKIFPIILTLLAFIPAVIQLGVGAIVSGFDQDVEVFKHEDYFTYVRIILVLFCAAVAPELIGRDQRNRTLSLYFSRAVSRLDYAIAKFAALTTAMLFLTLGPQVLLFVGNGMANDDLGGYIREKWDLVFPIVGASILVSTTIAVLGLVVASYLPRRAYSTAAIVGAVVLTLAAGQIVMSSVEASSGRWVLLATPMAWEGAVRWIFGVAPASGSLVDQADFAGWIWLLPMLALIAAGFAFSLRRLKSVTT